MQHFPSLECKAAAYAAFKDLERMLKEDGELPPGFSCDLSNVTVEVKIPNGTSVQRDVGEKGDGTIDKTATQNLYGWSILHECFRVATLFKQHKRLEKLLMKVVRRAIKRSVSTAEAFTELMPSRAKEIKALKDSLPVPKRTEDTPRMIVRDEEKPMPTVKIGRAHV